MPDTVTLTLDRHEADALLAWLDVATPERCTLPASRHDADGYAIPSDVAPFHAGYCPGDLRALDRISAALVRFRS